MHIIPSTFIGARETSAGAKAALETFSANKLNRDFADDAASGPRLADRPADDLRRVINRYDNCVTIRGVENTQQLERAQQKIFAPASELTTSGSFVLSWACAAAAGPVGVLAQPLLKSGIQAVICAAGAFSAAAGNIKQKLAAAIGGFSGSVKQDLRAVSHILSDILKQPNTAMKKYFAGFEHAHKTHAFIGSIIGGMVGTAVLGPIGAFIGLALGNYVGQAIGRTIAKAVAPKGEGPSWAAVGKQALMWGNATLDQKETEQLLNQLNKKEAQLEHDLTLISQYDQAAAIAKTTRDIIDITSVLEQGGRGNTKGSTFLRALTQGVRMGTTASALPPEPASITHTKRLAQLVELEKLAIAQAIKPKLQPVGNAVA